MSIWGNFIASLFASRFKTQSGSNLSTIINAVGTTLDGLDPAQTNLASQFSVTGSSGSGLDENGADWGVPRRAGESDASYKARILATLPPYIAGPTVTALSNVVKPFTGVAPLIFAASKFSQLFPLTFPLEFGGNTTQDYYTILLTMQNPNNVIYQRQDAVSAIDTMKRVIATVIVTWEDGTTTTIQ